MKISIITFHDVKNFGATLQCCAMSKHLDKYGADVEVIDYQPKYLKQRKSIFKEIETGKGIRKTLGCIKHNIKLLTYYGRLKRKEKRYDEFIHDNLRLTHRYESVSQLYDDPPWADLYICGSDQIWNPVLTGGKPDKAYFLGFVEGIKVSYGVSLGEVDITEYVDVFRDMTNDFKALSVREKTSAEELADALGKNVEVVLDCTLLLEENDYSPMESRECKIDEPYLLLYNIQHSLITIDIAKREAERRNLIIVDISPKPFKKVDGARHLLDIGPGEFLSLFKGASFVVTNSFHGCTFSIIYKKQFIAVPHTVRYTRMVDLMESLGLKDRIAYDNDHEICGEIVFDEVYELLGDMRNRSYRYIDSAIAY
ncbi:MAG: polysaccharide pyruvyl transferase family protein [Lachnospiraceae bacterium]|nr:polysaccharide pyruvyl transferase family protein [Lachnospiraceae bacterium]